MNTAKCFSQKLTQVMEFMTLFKLHNPQLSSLKGTLSQEKIFRYAKQIEDQCLWP